MPDNNIASGEGEGENTSFLRVYCLYVPRVLARVVGLGNVFCLIAAVLLISVIAGVVVGPC